MKKVFILLILFPVIAYSQPNSKYLKEYIGIGLKNNLELSAARENLRVYESRLDQAASSFLPRLDFQSRYTRAGGGRTFIFPMGDMLNPLYEIAGLPTRLENYKMGFILPHEQDTKLELVQPIFNLAIYHNYNINDEQYYAAKSEYETKAKNLRFSIQETYYNYQKAMQLVLIRKSTLALTNENYDVTKKLYDVDKAPKTDLLRSEVAMLTSKQELQSAENMLSLARNSFNQILNRDMDSPVNCDSVTIEELTNPDAIKSVLFDLNSEGAVSIALKSRHELEQLEHSIEAIHSGKKAMAADYFPSLSLVADYGITGEKYRISSDSRYWTVSGVFKWNLFAGMETNAKVQEMEAQLKATEMTRENLKQLIALEVKNNYIDFKNNLEMFEVARKTLESAGENYNLNKQRYQEGFGAYINLLDAQTTLSMSQSNYIITYFNILVSKAKLEKSIGKAEL